MKRQKRKRVNKSGKNVFYEGLEFVKDCRKFIYASIIIFVLSAVFGFVFADKLRFIDETLKQLVDKTAGLGGIELIGFIFWNNLQSAVIAIVLGFVFGIMPIINAITNGAVLGYVFEKVYHVTGISEFWRILPHGIFELPAIFIALGIGMRLGLVVFSKSFVKNFREYSIKAFYAIVFVIIPLLVVAAIIEGTLIVLGR